MTKLVISTGEPVGFAGIILVKCEEADWPVITGEGGYGNPDHYISPSSMEGDSSRDVPADPRLSGWPMDLVGILKVVDAACQPIDYLPDYFGVTIPDGQTLAVAHMRMGSDANYTKRLADAYREAGYDVEH